MSAKNEILHDRYRIIGQIGHGGMGTVYEAEDKKRFGKSIALKEILISTDEEPDFKQQNLLKQAFEREAKILAGLEHEAFPQVIDYFVEAERQFLVMELIQGENLSKLLEKRRKPFPFLWKKFSIGQNNYWTRSIICTRLKNRSITATSNRKI